MPQAGKELLKPGLVVIIDGNADDCAGIRRVLPGEAVMLLDRLGHAARPAFDGQDALAVAMAFRPEVVVLGIGWPRMNRYSGAPAARRSRHSRDHRWRRSHAVEIFDRAEGRMTGETSVRLRRCKLVARFDPNQPLS